MMLFTRKAMATLTSLDLANHRLQDGDANVVGKL